MPNYTKHGFAYDPALGILKPIGHALKPAAGGGGGGLSIENAQTNNTGQNASTLTISSYTVTDADVLFVGVYTGYSGGACFVSSVVFNTSESFTSTTAITDSSWCGCQLWYLNSPTATTADIVVTMSFAHDLLVVGAWGVVNGDGASLGTIATNSGTSTSPSVTVSSASGEMAVGIVCSEDNNGVTTSDNEIFSVTDSATSDISCAAAYQDGATSVVLDWSSPNVTFAASGLSVPEV